MITQELLGYIRAESTKGRTREEINRALISGGGWSSDDLSEAFREIFPMQSAVLPKEKPTIPAIPPALVVPPPPISMIPPVSFIPPIPKVVPTPTISFVPPKFIVPPPPISFTPPSFSQTSPKPSPSFSIPTPSLLKSTPPSSEPTSSSHFVSFLLKFLIILVIVGGLGFGAWYYRSKVINLWDYLTNKSTELPVSPVDMPVPSLDTSAPSLDTSTPSVNTTPNTDLNNQAVVPNPVQPPVIQIKNCGVMNTTLKLDTPSTYQNDFVLSCLGDSAVNCEDAQAFIKDDFFPTIFKITKSADSCNFKLSYPMDSTLTDIFGTKLAGQYISCPISIVKAIDNTKPATPKFIAPDKTNLSKYGSDIYFYGTLGLFVENNLDINKIQGLGCEGGYIQSVIASYIQKKK